MAFPTNVDIESNFKRAIETNNTEALSIFHDMHRRKQITDSIKYLKDMYIATDTGAMCMEILKQISKLEQKL